MLTDQHFQFSTVETTRRAVESLSNMQPALSWDKSYARQRTPQVYKGENARLRQIYGLSPSSPNEDLITIFLEHKKRNLDPPVALMYASIDNFLRRIVLNSTQTQWVLFDERRDPTGGSTSTRIWDSEGHSPGRLGYMDYPPAGEDVLSIKLKPAELKGRMNQLCDPSKVKKRVIFTVNPTPEIVLSIIDSIALRTIPAFRLFLQSYILHKPRFRIHFSLAQAFNLEFHIPLFALRKGSSKTPDTDPRVFNAQNNPAFRQSYQLPLSRDGVEEDYCYHEAQLSFFLTGMDEWLWTSYCFVDTYFGAEKEWEQYLQDEKDPSTGGAHALRFPVWNPREYFLETLERRMTQATREWSMLVSVFEDRMTAYEQESLLRFTDDANLTHTKKLTFAVSAIRRFRDAISTTIEAWDIFERSQIHHLQTTGSDALRSRWEEYISAVRGNISELRYLRSLLAHKLDLFNSMRDGLVNASSLRESAASTSLSATATKQGENIGILTKMTVLYLPLSLVTAVFSISMIPESSSVWYSGVLWACYIVLLVLVIGLTLYAALKPERFLNRVFPENGQAGLFPFLRHWLGS